MQDLEANDEAVRFHAVHAASLDVRRAIFRAFELDDAVDLGDPAAIRVVLDLFVAAAGYGAPQVGWHLVEEAQALAALDGLVRFDQAYSVELVRPEDAAALVSDFAALFPVPRIWQTNAAFTE